MRGAVGLTAVSEAEQETPPFSNGEKAGSNMGDIYHPHQTPWEICQKANAAEW